MTATGIRARSPLPIVILTFIAGAAMAQSIEGSATFRERMALPPGAVLEVVLEDVSRAGAAAETIARTRIPSPDTAVTVITDGNPTKVALMLRRVGGHQTPPPGAGGAKPLEGTYWRATELAGKPTPKQDPKREAHLQFQEGKVFGSDGCNRVTGTFQLKGDALTFGPMAATQMACVDSSGIEGPFHEALKNAARLTVAGDRLELFDAKGTRLAVFTAGTTGSLGSAPSPASGLTGTSWRLVEFQSMDDTKLTPDDRTKYTIEFAAGGKLIARIDCNRGSGTWKSSGPSEVQFGPLALTRAQCPPGSLHDQIVRQWSNITSYVIRDGHLFLALKIDSGIYEFEPIPKSK